MEFKNGFKIKPHKVSEDGVITFTDGTNTGINPSGVACKAYGYDYRDGLCRAFVPSVNISKIGNSQTNTIKGKNTVPYNVNNSIIQGDNIELSGYNNNIIANGKNHFVDSQIENGAILSGVGGKLNNRGEAVINSHEPTKAGHGQLSTVMLNCNTTDNSTVFMMNQTASSSTSASTDPKDHIILPKNSVVGIEMYLTRLEIGGASGTAGNYSYRRNQQALRIDDDGVGTLVNFNTKNIAKTNVNGSFTLSGATITDEYGINRYALYVSVSDRNNVNNYWSAILYLHITSTTIALTSA